MVIVSLIGWPNLIFFLFLFASTQTPPLYWTGYWARFRPRLTLQIARKFGLPNLLYRQWYAPIDHRDIDAYNVYINHATFETISHGTWRHCNSNIMNNFSVFNEMETNRICEHFYSTSWFIFIVILFHCFCPEDPSEQSESFVCARGTKKFNNFPNRILFSLYENSKVRCFFK